MRIALAVAAPAAAVLSVPVAWADNSYDFGPYDFTPTAPLTETGTGGAPPIDTQTDYTGLFDVTNNGANLGDVDGILRIAHDIAGFTNYYLDTTSTAAGIPEGSQFDAFDWGNGFETVYTSIAGAVPTDEWISNGTVIYDMPTSLMQALPLDSFIPPVALG